MREIAIKLQEVLTDEYLLSGELLALIGQERQHLERGDQDGMNACVRQKRQLLVRLEGVTAERVALLQQAGLLDKGGIGSAWTASLDQFPALARQHSQLPDLVQQLRDENQLLGMLLNSKTRFVSRLLDTLKPDTGNAGIYQSNGSRQSSSDGPRKLISV